MIRKPISRGARVALMLLSVAILAGGYTWLSYRQHQENPRDTTIPSWSQLGEGVSKAFRVDPREEHRWIVVDAAATGKRLALGMAFGVVGALLLGLLMGTFTAAEAFWTPPLSLLAQIPPTAALAVFFVMVGTDTEMYVTMIAFGVLPTLAQVVYLGVRAVPDEELHKAYTLGASHFEVVFNVVLPRILPPVIDAVRLQFGPAMVYLIAAEMVCADVGFGYRIRLMFKLLNMNVVYPYLAALAAFGYIVDRLLRLLQRKACPWYLAGGR